MAERKFRQPSSTDAQQHFAKVPAAEIERSRFDRSHAYKSTIDAGLVYPVYVDEVLPGDSFDMNATAFARLATPLKPFMDNVYMDLHFFYVPYRFLWDHFEQFMGERRSATDDPANYTIPQVTIDLATIGTGSALPDYMGLPLVPSGPPNNQSVSALPFRAYKMIWRDWYRDQNLVDWFDIGTGDGPDATAGICLGRAKRRDYFTSCLPWPQAGDPVVIPIGDSAPVVRDPSSPGNPQLLLNNTGADRNIIGTTVVDGGTPSLGYGGAVAGAPQTMYWSNTPGSTGLMADLQEATAISINELRTAFQIQRLLERDARGGMRYVEVVLSHFGVTSDDHRLGRPEFLGGGTFNVNINPVASTFAGPDTAQGNLAAFGTALGRASFNKSFTEHGIVMGMLSVRADLTYQQGIERFWSRKTRYDFYWPSLAHLGEQAVLNKELYVDPTVPGNDDLVFGYQERYAEYRYKPSRVTGQFSSAHPTSLDVWHLAEDFLNLPALNSQFIYEGPPIERVVAVTDEPHFLLDIWFSLQCARPMPVYSVPGMIDHF